MEGALVDRDLDRLPLARRASGRRSGRRPSRPTLRSSRSRRTVASVSSASSRTSSVSASFASTAKCTMISEPSASVSFTTPRSRLSAGVSGARATSSRSSGRMPRTTACPAYAWRPGCAATVARSRLDRLRAGRGRRSRRRLPLERRLEHVHRRAADEPADEQVDRPVVERLRMRDLLQLALPHHGDAVAHRHGFDLVVCDVDRGHPEPLLQAADLGPHLHAQLRVEVRERLVHQERLRLANDRPSHRHPLALTAGERPGLALEERLQVEDPGRLLHPPVDLRLRQLLDPEAEGDVLVHVQVRVERVALKHHRDIPVARRHVVDDALADLDHARRDVLEAGDHAQRRRLPAAGRADEHHELAVGDVQLQVRRRPLSRRERPC